ncbi:site-specific integrase [Lysobacter capsici]|uniref:site-specific integrase n=1 Tax=Lysobacter capsici TaxID=435897 RepID=UPI001C004DBF|nr:site-specific integrase [Lysobacter capsici]QWF18137.1 site-specific integrase [Lysobacter capsici]
MPKPYFLSRPAGLYVRFRVPEDLRLKIGLRFVVRSMRGLRGDAARLSAAQQAVALSAVFDRLRKGDDDVAKFDAKKLIESVQRAADEGRILEWKATGVRVGGVDFGTVTTHGRQDTLDFIETMKAAAAIAPSLPITSAPVAPVPEPPASAGPMLSEAIADYLRDLESAKRDPKTVVESRHSLRILLGVVGDVPASTLSQSHVRAFFDAVRHWPSNATKRPEYRSLSVPEVLALSKARKEPEPAAHTLNKHRQRLSAFVQPLLAARVMSHNPMAGIVRMSAHAASAEVETGRPFTTAELQAIFAPSVYLPWAQKYPHRYWAPILGLYSGARVTEVAQLYVDDIETVDGVPGFHVNRRFPGQKIKNAQSRRFVPLAQPVLHVGFLAFVEETRKAGQARLFPDLPNGTGLGFGRQLSRQFSAYVKKCGVVDEGMGFHAFRHTFATLLSEAGAETADIARLTGHLDGKAQGSVLEKFYIDRKTLPLRVGTLTRFTPSVVLPTQSFL